MECPRCSELVDPGAAYCGNCGTALNAAVVGQPPASAAPSAAEVPTLAPTVNTPGASFSPMPVAQSSAASTSFQQPAFVAPQGSEPVVAPEPPVINTAPTIMAPGGIVPAMTPLPASTQASLAIPAGVIEAPQPVAYAAAPPAPIAAPVAPLPAYAVVDPNLHKVEGKAMTALILSILALPGSIIPLIGWALAITGIVMATSVRSRLPRKTMSNVAIGFASLAVLLSSGVFVYSFNSELNDSKDDQSTSDRSTNLSSSTNDTTTNNSGKAIDTPCYTLDAPGLPNIDSDADSCQVQAYNDTTLDISTNALNIEGVSQDKITAANLDVAGKEIANNYLRTTAPDLVVTSQGLGTFAKSPAYIIAGKSGGNVTLELALVVHKTAHGENVFVLAHAINDATADISQFESSWTWK